MRENANSILSFVIQIMDLKNINLLYSNIEVSLVNNKKILKYKIQQKELQIKKLHLHQSSSDVCAQLYNTLILEKAILKRQLNDINKNPIIEKIKKSLPRREKLICDYFKS